MPGRIRRDSTTFSDHVAQEVRAEMGRQSLSARALASLMPAMKEQALRDRLKGRTPFTVTELDDLAAALDVPVATFFDGYGDDEKGRAFQKQLLAA